eukprot:g16577.t1
MLHALRKYRNWLPRNKRKVAQQMPKTGICQGFTLGLTTDYKVGGQGTPVISKATRAHPGLAEALCRGCRSANPEFHFTSIQVNLNTKYGMHTDGFDAGPSRMIALGNFSKGHLWLHDCRRNHWSLVDVRNTWIAFDGREFHLTEDWEGPERYSLVFFTNHLWDELLPEAQTQLLNLGFHWPRESHVFREDGRPLRAFRARRVKRDFTATASCCYRLCKVRLEGVLQRRHISFSSADQASNFV